MFIGWTITKLSTCSSIIVEQFVAAITCYQLLLSWQILNIIFSILCKLIYLPSTLISSYIVITWCVCVVSVVCAWCACVMCVVYVVCVVWGVWCVCGVFVVCVWCVFGVCGVCQCFYNQLIHALIDRQSDAHVLM